MMLMIKSTVNEKLIDLHIYFVLRTSGHKIHVFLFFQSYFKKAVTSPNKKNMTFSTLISTLPDVCTRTLFFPTIKADVSDILVTYMHK